MHKKDIGLFCRQKNARGEKKGTGKKKGPINQGNTAKATSDAAIGPAIQKMAGQATYRKIILGESGTTEHLLI
ncbi:MAG: hypothetical protein GY765_07615 [bacterium]|nr:hypothetical protein [bacterium]